MIQADISKEMRNSYLDYAMSVIVSRALPDVRDGLKPVHRRILYGMYDMGIRAGGATKKSARIVGEVLGKYHPHGDASVYDALVRLAQDFSLRYPVIKPQGNFGSIDGDSPAAMRYTEAKLSLVGEAMLNDLQKETVAFGPNYDDSLEEPLVLPAAFPFLLANGSDGIAVGMATKMVPHNIKEIIDAVCAEVDNPDITTIELMQFMKGPDFPTGGVICGSRGIKDAFETGRGKIVLRGRYNIEEAKGHETHDKIIFYELPYQVNKAELVVRINDLRRDTSVERGIAAVQDESDREGIRLVIEIKKGFSPDMVLNHLFSDTQLQINVNVNNLALVNGRPEVLNLKDMIKYYVLHREDVITKRTNFDLGKALERAHVLEGLKIGLDNIDAVIEIIKHSESNDTASIKLCEAFGLDDIQAKAIINMRLGRLSHMETQEIVDELTEVHSSIAYFRQLLSDHNMLLSVVKDEARAIAAQFGDRRRTDIDPRELEGAVDKDFVKKEDVVVTASARGFVKRVSAEEYKAQARGGKGVKGAALRDEDFIVAIFVANSHDNVMFITNHGRAFYLGVYEIPEGVKTSKGVSIRTLLPKLEDDETVTTVLTFSEFDETTSVLMATKYGVTKRVMLNAFINAKRNGIKAIILDEGDALVQCEFVEPGGEAMIISRQGKGLRFNVDDVRTMGRSTRGVKGLRLADGDEIIGLLNVDAKKKMLLITSQGKGKCVEYNQFNVHGRATAGQRIYDPGKGTLVGALSVDDNNDIVAMTKKGQTVRFHVKDISVMGRAAAGVILVRMKLEDDEIVSVAAADYQEEELEEVNQTVIDGAATPQENVADSSKTPEKED